MSEFLPAEPAIKERYASSRYYRYLLVPLMLVCFFQIEHNWDASTKVEAATGIAYDGTENRTADRSSGVNAGSSSSRIMLACFAMLGLGIPCNGRFNFTSPPVWCLLLYVFWMLASTMWATEPAHTGYKAVVLAVFTFTAFGISRQLTLEQIGRTFALVCVGFIFLGIVAELSFGTLRIVGDYRFAGTVHPNTEAAYGTMACIAAVLFYRPDKRSSLFVAVFIFVVGLTCLMLTKSRTSLAAMIIGVTAFYAIRFRGMKRLILISVVSCGLAIGGLLVTVVSTQFKNALGDAAAMGRSDDLGELTGRLPLWEELMEWVAHKPLFGYGYLSMWTTERVEYLGDLFKWEIPHAHNMYLDTVLDGGLVGLTFLLLYLIVGLASAARRFLRTGNDGAAFCFAMIVFAFVHGGAESFFKQTVFVNMGVYAMIFRLGWTTISESDKEPDKPIEAVAPASVNKPIVPV